MYKLNVDERSDNCRVVENRIFKPLNLLIFLYLNSWKPFDIEVAVFTRATYQYFCTFFYCHHTKLFLSGVDLTRNSMAGAYGNQEASVQ